MFIGSNDKSTTPRPSRRGMIGWIDSFVSSPWQSNGVFIKGSNKKLRLAIIFGGQSAEHEVSVASAKNIFESLDKNKYRPKLIYITKFGEWRQVDDQDLNSKLITQALVEPGSKIPNLSLLENIDVAFPVLHGPFGEDGTIQGLLKILNIPCVGAGVLGSAVGMDKDISKRLLKEAGVKVARHLVFNSDLAHSYEQVVADLDTPFFIKPANLGSSVGITKVADQAGFEPALADAFSYDTKIIAEEFISGREIECSVLGNEDPRASLPGEVISHTDFYSYEAKYLNKDGAELIIPASLDEKQIRKIQDLAINVFKTLECWGMARVDFFLQDNDQLVVNEINTIPGFTNISMFPKLWEVSGLAYPDLIDKLISLAIERSKSAQKLKTSYHLPE